MKQYLLLLTIFIWKVYPQNYQIPKIEYSPKSYVCYKTQDEIFIDGKLNEKSWHQARWTDDFLDIEGTIRQLPRYKTRAKMLWDENFFYVAAELEEPDIWATLTERDAIIFHDNDFEVFIDPDGDTHEYYEFEINAFNTVWDLFLVKPYRDGGPAINSWDIKGLKSSVKINGTINQPSDKDNGWTIEIAFPWDVLSECAHKDVPPKSGDLWRVNFSRVEWKVETKDGKYQKVIDPETGKTLPEDNWVWSPQDLINMHYPEMWGFVQFSNQTVGSKEEQFNYPVDEEIKWNLRKIYYAEKKYFELNKKYTDNLNELGLSNKTIDGYLSPTIQITPTLFEAIMTSTDEKTTWHISQDGKTWKN